MLSAGEHAQNPFRYSEPVPIDELIARDAEAAILLERASEGNNSRLVAPRRFGKTSLLRRALHDAQREGWAAVYVDFFGVLTLDDIAQRIERAYAEQLPGRLAFWFSGVRRMLRPTVRAGGGPIPGAVEVTVDAQAEPPSSSASPCRGDCTSDTDSARWSSSTSSRTCSPPRTAPTRSSARRSSTTATRRATSSRALTSA
jgi:hypothetical protein